jgi:hypothetical protein
VENDMSFCRKAALLLAVGTALGSGLAVSAQAQEWETAVALGTYAVYSVNREVGGVADQAEYFIQTFGADGTVTIINYVLKTPPAAEGQPLHTLAASLCQGTYTPEPGGLHKTTCGDDTIALMIQGTGEIDGVLVATEMRGINMSRGTAVGEVLQYSYRRLPDGWENAVMRGTYSGHYDYRHADGYTGARFFHVNVPAEGVINWHHAINVEAGDVAGTILVEEEEDFIDRNYAPNGRFPGIHQALNTETGAPTFDWLILDAEMIDGVMVATEVRGFGVGAGPSQWHYFRIGEAW